MRITRITAVVPAALLAIVLAAAAQPPPGTSRAPAPAARRCTAGVIAWGNSIGPPAVVSSYWKSNGCGQYQSPELLDNSNTIHYGDSWRTGVGKAYTSSASSPNKLAKSWIRYKNTPGGQIWCLRIYPTVGASWFKASGSVC